MTIKRLLLGLAVGSLVVPAMARASESEARPLSLTPMFNAPADPQADAAPDALAPDAAKSPKMPTLTLDEAPVGLKIHGFAQVTATDKYLTPRGVNVNNHGVQIQPLAGLVFDVYDGTDFVNNVSIITGVWSDFTSHHPSHTGTADAWSEFDFFAGVSVTFAKNFTFSSTWDVWQYPASGGPPSTQYNWENKIAFDDSQYLHDFALHPYVNIFWNYAGSSVVGLGTNHTVYAEVGVTPSYTLKAIENYPITFSLPIYYSFGDSHFWGNGLGNTKESSQGVFCAGLKASIPLAFIPKQYGAWYAFAGVTYINTINPSLTYFNTQILGNGTDRNIVAGYSGVGFNF